MKSTNVVITGEISDEYLQKITDISPRIKLEDVSDLFSAEQNGDDKAKDKLDAVLSEAEVIFGGRLPQNIISRAPKLKWIQVRSAGVERFLDSDMVSSSVTITNAKGVQSIAIGEFVLQLMLMFIKQAVPCFHMKQEKQWSQVSPSMLHSRTVGLLGLGSIGQEVARLAKAFNMKVIAVDAKRVVRTRYVDTILPPAQLPKLLCESDFVVSTLPITAETRKMIGEKELRAMKSSAYLINISRGGIIDEQALIRALDEKWIAGAGLDVFASEPLPADNRLWEIPNVILSPHIAGSFEDRTAGAIEIFLENLGRYVNGKKLFNIVNKKKGY
ncbi:D-2-hydroxyacid dehydrogenase [Chloroflexota bacterium]